MAAKKAKAVRVVPKSKVRIFKIANRHGYAAIAVNHLTEGRTACQAYARLRKACRRNGGELGEATAAEIARLVRNV